MDIKSTLVGAGAVVLLAGGIFGAAAVANAGDEVAPTPSVTVEPTTEAVKVAPPAPVEPEPVVTPEVAVPEPVITPAPEPAPVAEPVPAAPAPLPAPTVNVDENGAANGDPNNAGSSE
jgi:outer membrane biosynthesis protein TonB